MWHKIVLINQECNTIVIESLISVTDVISEGDHTRVKTMVTSKVGGLTAFTKKKETCIGCKTPLDRDGGALLSHIDISQQTRQFMGRSQLSTFIYS